ncbi:MAG: glucokinase [Acidobacteria bacterium 13_1_40CM_4_69_4]|nr:MAG: glucokinase [Acidobacteria bacterium 13_1_40CM_4_69_4]
MILAGDIGATKTRLALFAGAPGRSDPVSERTYASHDYPGLEVIALDFIRATGASLDRACFGVAGPVRDGRCSTTNLAWVVDSRDLARDLRLPRVALLNDLEASAYGLEALHPDERVVLQEGSPGATGHAALIAAGTGLGEAGLYWDGRRHRPFATEGGHAAFAPADETQIDLLRYLLRHFEQVSWERVLSGPGIVNLYSFLRDSGRGEEPPWLAEEISAGDPAAVISSAALTGRSRLCLETLDLFVALYGAEAGNLALKVMASGGVFIGGGIAPKILPRLRGPAFVRAFVSKGRMRPLLEAMPVRVVLNDRLALLGAARYAATEAPIG